MEKKMKGIADPFTLGIIIALVGSVSAATLTGDNDQNVAQNVSEQSSNVAMISLNDETDE